MRIIAGAACAVFLLLTGFFMASSAAAQPAPAPTAKVQVQPLNAISAPLPASQFDAEKATDAYLATIKGQARKKSDAYFEGGYVLLLVDALYTIVVAALLLWLRISAWMRNVAQGWNKGSHTGNSGCAQGPQRMVVLEV